MDHHYGLLSTLLEIIVVKFLVHFKRTFTELSKLKIIRVLSTMTFFLYSNIDTIIHLEGDILEKKNQESP